MRTTLALLVALGAAVPALAPATAAPTATPAPAITSDIAALTRLADRLRRLEEDGLDPAAYAVPPDALARQDPVAWQAALHRAAAAAVTDLLHGRLREPPPGRADIRRDAAAVPLGPWLAALAGPEPAAAVERAALATPGAGPLRAALARARALAAAGGWAPIPGGAPAETVEPGVDDPVRVPLLRARLLATDPALAATPGLDRTGTVYEEPLAAAVRRFQEAQGLEADGRVGPATRAALNRTPEAIARQLRVALDLRRAAAAPEPGRRIEVNVAHQRLTVLDGARPVLDMAAIVGRPARATPMLRTRLTAVQFNPPWGVPERNAREDLLPRLRRDPRALMEKGFRFYATVDGERVEVDPTTVDWRGVTPQGFPYAVRQDAGDANALGRLKFVMPNGDDIYMHDTPDRHLFRRAERAFSSGCIRLERPMELLDAALEGTAGWDRARAQRALDGRQTSVVPLGRTPPVRLHYTTVVVEGGEVRMRSDIYGLDEAYARAMDAANRAPPRVAARPAAVLVGAR